MTLDRFKVFAAVAKHHNATRAAQELHISQPAVTKQLKLLEKNYNAKLYTRFGRGIELTERGRVFLRDVKTILRRYERLGKKFSAASSTAKVETLTVGGSYSPSASLLPSVLALFRRRHPHVQVDFRTASRATIERLILNSEVDIAVLNNAPSNPSLTIEPYRSEPFVAFVPANHPLTRKPELTLQEFERFPLIIRRVSKGKGTTEQLLTEMKRKGLNPNIAMRCESPDAVKAAVRTKMGVGILFKETIEAEVRRGEFKIIKLPMKNFTGESSLVYRKDRSLSASAQDFLNLLRQRQQRSIGDQRRNVG